MLKRVTSALFEETDDSVGLAVLAQNNNGVESAIFDYDSTVLPNGPIQGHPGCSFDVLPGIHQFRVLVVFDPGAPATARYDLFQVNTAGTLVPVGKSVTSAAGTPLIGFGIDGIAVPAAVGVGASVGAAPAGARRGGAPTSPPPPTPRKKTPRRTTRKTAPKRKAVKKSATKKSATKKTATKKTAAKKKTSRTPAKRKSTTARPTTRRGKSSARKRR